MNDSLTQNSQQNFNRSHFKCRKKNSSLVIERMPQSLTPGVISVSEPLVLKGQTQDVSSRGARIEPPEEVR